MLSPTTRIDLLNLAALVDRDPAAVAEALSFLANRVYDRRRDDADPTAMLAHRLAAAGEAFLAETATTVPAQEQAA